MDCACIYVQLKSAAHSLFGHQNLEAMEDLSLSSDFYKYDLPVNRMCFAKQSS
jgi:hypothetical protein